MEAVSDDAKATDSNRHTNGKPGRGISLMAVTLPLVFFLTACASVPPQTDATRRIMVYTTMPTDVAVEVVGNTQVTHGRGCGGFGARGSREGAEMLLRQQAVAHGADAVLVTDSSPPHLVQGCHLNRYILTAKLLRLPILTYVPPIPNPDGSTEFRYEMPADFDETWSSLVDAVSSSFFEVTNYEKDSGLLTLSFDPDLPSDYVDCGGWEKSYPTGEVGFDGPYVDWLQLGSLFDLSTRINLRVKSLTRSRTEVEITALYSIKAPSHGLAFKFKTNSTSKKSIQNLKTAAPGTPPLRICQSTHKLEHELISEIGQMASAR